MKLQPWLLNFEYVPEESNTMPDALSRQEWNLQDKAMEGVQLSEKTAASKEKHQSGEGGCGGPAPTTSGKGTASSAGTPTGEGDSGPAAGRPGLEAATVTG